MITLYAVDSPNVLKIYLALEELGLAYEARPIDVMSGGNFAPDFMRLNPNGKVPVIQDANGPDGQPITIFESGAILVYLAEKAERLLPADPGDRYQTFQWLMVQMSGLGPLFGQYIHFLFFAADGNDYALSRYSTHVHRILAAIETRLGEAEWLGGRDYSIADVATFPWARPLVKIFGAGIEKDYPGMMRWVNRIAARPATARALAAVEQIAAVTTALGDATPESLDRVFGRGEHARVAG